MQVKARPGALIADDLSAEGFGPLRWVLWNPDAERLVMLRIGAARRGWAWSDAAWQQLQTAALGALAPTAALFGE